VGVRDRREREVLDQLLGLLHTIEISTKITQQAGLWRREYGKSHGTGIIDALIAACADALQIPLATLTSNTSRCCPKFERLVANKPGLRQELSPNSKKPPHPD